jgi:Cu2+-exporting ATPase
MVPLGLDDISADDRAVLLALAQPSSHPMARAIALSLRDQAVAPAPLHDVAETAGQGMTAYDQSVRVALVRPDDGTGTACDYWRDGTLVARIGFADPIRSDAPEAVRAMQAMGIGCSILSGDTAEGVRAAAQATGLWAQTSARPTNKIAAIERVQAQGAHVLMIGDGLNDGPALAAATAAMAPASASDAGRQAADLVFMGEALSAIPFAVMTARRTQTIVRQNLALAVGYNLIAVPLAIMGMVTPLIAALAMSGSSLLVIGNALRLARGGAA